MAPNYFTCTLGEAAKHNLTQPHFEKINAFLDYQAEHVPKLPAVGFFEPQKDGSLWKTSIYNYHQLQHGSLSAAVGLQDIKQVRHSKTVALLCPSCEDFMFLWLGLIRLNIQVLLIAPQCQPDAILHLCKQCDADVLLYHKSYGRLARETMEAHAAQEQKSSFHAIDARRILGHGVDPAHFDSNEHYKFPPPTATLQDIAYIHHTSGTSTGLPKPIHQAHNAAVGALPRIPKSKDHATFTTTPLYHGGIADCFRSWTSGAMIWLFPGKDVPITRENIVKALEATTNAARHDKMPHVKFFSCVPYVLQLLEEKEDGLDWLRRMDIVGVGGAALSDEVGDRLVSKGVNLVSRFGSSECGFMMSSHRDYKKDKSWQFLRDNVGADFLRFEKQEDGLSELVVLPTWPHRAKTNREDGSFATADLFEPHPEISNAWRYHSRADSQLTLITGKKFDPAPLEAHLASSEMIADVLIFGNGKPYPGALIFRAAGCWDYSDEDVINHIWPSLELLNSKTQDHARIAKDMIKPMKWQSEPLEKSSKGTLIRKKVEARFAREIERAYSEKDEVAAKDVSDDGMEKFVLETVMQTLGRSKKLNADTDLFAYGVDSVAAMRIRGRLQGLLGNDKTLPMTVVENCGTIALISKFIVDLRNGKTSKSGSTEELELMRDLVEEYSRFCKSDQSQTNGHNGIADESRQTVILTGATGALGTHFLDLCARNSRVKKVVCLIRGQNQHAAKERLDKAFEGRQLKPLTGADVEIEVLPAKLGEPFLGLEDDVYARIAEEATVIVHLAWEVNFRMNLRSFRGNSIAGTMNLINLALASSRPKPPRFAFCSSVASVMSRQGDISEKPSPDPNDASPLGYSRSKWVAEQICLRATTSTRLQGRTSILRVGQLAGDTDTGVWNEKEAWPMMLSTVKLVKALPEIKNEPLNWLPINVAAQAFVEAAVERITDVSDEAEVVHVLNQHRETTWMDLLGWLKKEVEFEVVSPAKWIEKLEEQQSNGVDHPAFRLIGLWKENLVKDESQVESNEAAPSAPHLETIRSVRAAPVLADVKPVQEEYFMKIWKWIDGTL